MSMQAAPRRDCIADSSLKFLRRRVGFAAPTGAGRPPPPPPHSKHLRRVPPTDGSTYMQWMEPRARSGAAAAEEVPAERVAHGLQRCERIHNGSDRKSLMRPSLTRVLR